MHQERLRLGGEEQRPRQARVVERLLPEAVAGEQEPSPRAVPEREGEHALEALEAGGPLLLVGVEDHLGVRPRREEVSPSPQVVAQLAGVVDLPVRHQPHGAVLVRQRLLARHQIDDAEASRREPDAAVHPDAVLVRSAVRDGGGHGFEDVPGRRPGPIELEDSDDATHRCAAARLAQLP